MELGDADAGTHRNPRRRGGPDPAPPVHLPAITKAVCGPSCFPPALSFSLSLLLFPPSTFVLPPARALSLRVVRFHALPTYQPRSGGHDARAV